MILTKIWQRYFLKEIFKVFFLFLFSFYFLFVILDASSHVQDFIRESKLQLKMAAFYYFFQFVKYADLIVPLAVLISTIKVLCSFNVHRELVALQASGVKTKTLLRPFFFVGLLATLFMYCNFEFINPKALGYINHFYESHFKHSYHGKRKEPIHVLHLKDNSKLIYQTTIPSKEYFFDLLWVRSFDDIMRIKYLKTDPKNPQAFFIDHIKRNSKGQLEKAHSYDHKLLTELKWDPKMTLVGKIPVENRKTSELFNYLIKKKTTNSYQPSEIKTHFLFKLLMPLLSILVVAAVAPSCLSYSRNIPTFFIYCISLFGFIAFFTLIDSCTIIGENKVISPYLALITPFATAFGLFGIKLIRV